MEKQAFDRVLPRCSLFETCGGCTLQDLSYADQLFLKKQRVERFLAEAGVTADVSLTGLEEPWRYRNKAEFSFGEDKGQLSLGFHAARSFSRIIDLDDCFLLPQPMLDLLHQLRRLSRQSGLPAYHLKSHRGFFRYAILRQSHATGKMQLCLLTGSASGDYPLDCLRGKIEAIFHALAQDNPHFHSGYWGITDKLSDVALPETLEHLHGEAFLEEAIGPFKVSLHPLTFLQSSTIQAQRLYEAIADRLKAGCLTAWDLYCGIGLISFYLSGRVGHIYGIEQSAASVSLANLNAKRNGVSNASFYEGAVEDVLKDRRFWLKKARPDVVIVDPPRTGLNPAVIASIVCAKPLQIGYVSCNVQSLARDLKLILSSFPRYQVESVESFDMFAQTDHVETLAWLRQVG